MDSGKPQFLYRGIVVDEKLLIEKPVFGIDLTPPNPPIYDEKGRKAVRDGNEYGVYMSDYKAVATDVYAAASMSDGTPLNSKVRIGNRALMISVPAVGIVYRISTEGLDIHKPWITESLKGVYNNGYKGNEWVVDRVPVSHYTVDKVIVGEDILHPKKEITFNNQEEILLKITLELNERKKRLQRFEMFIESLPRNQVLAMMPDELNVYREIYKKHGLIETNLETFKISDCYDCIKMLMAYYYQANLLSLPMYELKYLANLQNVQNLSFADFNKKILKDLRDLSEKKNKFIIKQRSLGREVNTQYFDIRINFLTDLYNRYHVMMIKQVTTLTGVAFDSNVNSINDIRQTEEIVNQKLEEIYYNGELSIQLYQALKEEIHEEADRIASIYISNTPNNSVNEVSVPQHK